MLCFISLFCLLFTFCILFSLGEFIGWLGGIWLIWFNFLIIFSCFIILFCSYSIFDFYLTDTSGIFLLDFSSYITFFNTSSSISFYFSTSNIIILFTLIMISFLVHVFAFHYMSFDNGRLFFLCILCFFTFSMASLISISNFVFMLIFFELVSWSSFILISWFMSYDSFRSSVKAIMLSRFSDGIFLSILFEIYSYSNSFSVEVFDFSRITNLYFFLLCFIFLLSKSAIFPFHSWLIWAMAGPTPVSSLLHSATLVTTSYVILTNFFYFYTNFFSFSFFLTYVMFNIIFGSLFSIFSFDVKKLIAYSTMSQISLIIVFFFYSPDLSFLYFTSHGFVKSSIFMCVGFVFHFYVGQDIRSVYGSYFFVRFYYLGIFFCVIFLSSFPLSILFYVKDFILDSYFIFFDSFSLLNSILLNYCIFLTSIYSYFVLNVFFGLPYKFPDINIVYSCRSYNYYSCYYLLFFYIIFFSSYLSDIPLSYSVFICLISSNILSLITTCFTNINMSSFSSNTNTLSSLSFGFYWDSFINFFGYLFISLSLSIFFLLEYFLFEYMFFFTGSILKKSTILSKSNYLYYIILSFLCLNFLLITFIF